MSAGASLQSPMFGCWSHGNGLVATTSTLVARRNSLQGLTLKATSTNVSLRELDMQLVTILCSILLLALHITTTTFRYLRRIPPTYPTPSLHQTKNFITYLIRFIRAMRGVHLESWRRCIVTDDCSNFPEIR